jgi:hypothetical protein
MQTRLRQWKTKMSMITNLICWVHWNENINYSTYIYVFAAGWLLSALLFSQEGFCPPSHFYGGRAYVHPVIFTGGLLSTLSLFDGRAFDREGFCPTLNSYISWWNRVNKNSHNFADIIKSDSNLYCTPPQNIFSLYVLELGHWNAYSRCKELWAYCSIILHCSHLECSHKIKLIGIIMLKNICKRWYSPNIIKLIDFISDIIWHIIICFYIIHISFISNLSLCLI